MYLRMHVCVSMYVCSLIAPEGIHQSVTNLAFKPGKDLGKSKLRGSVLRSSLGEDGFCKSEIKHNKRTAPRSELFISASRLQEV
jgi:hypothetical protein